MRHLIRIINIGGYFVRIFPCIVTEHILITLIAGSDYNKLRIIIHDLFHHFCDQIQAFLICQTGDKTDQHLILIYCKTQSFLKCPFISRFSFMNILDIVIGIDLAICLRIPDIVIDTIDDSSQIHVSCRKKSIQSFAILRCLNLLCISFADSRNIICIYQTALQHVGVSLILQLVRGKYIIRKSCQSLHRLNIPDSLESQVMNRHNRFDTAIKFACCELRLQIYRNQTCLPVMAVDQIRAEAYDRQDREHCLVKESKLLNISTEISVRFRPPEIDQIVNKIIGDALILIGHDTYMCTRIIRTGSHIKMRDILEIISEMIWNTSIVRKHYPDIPLIFIESLRKSSTYVRQSSCFHERYTLRCCKQYFSHK